MNKDDWSSSDDEGDDDFDEVEDDDDNLAFYSLCSYYHNNPSSSPAFPTLELALQYDIDNYGFDFLSYLLKGSNDEDEFFEYAIICVNLCRRYVMDRLDSIADEEGNSRTKDTFHIMGKWLKEQQQDGLLEREEIGQYYKPVIDDDAMLMCMDEMRELKRRREEEEQGVDAGVDESAVVESTATTRWTTGDDSANLSCLRERVSTLEGELSRAKACIASLLIDDDNGDDDAIDDEVERRLKPNENRSSSRDWKSGRLVGKGKSLADVSSSISAAMDNDSYYFNSYSNTSIHETMLKDTVRTAAYERAILSNAESLFHNKIVLDVGCGTGVLSLFCAKAGARKVIAVDNSDVIEQAREIAKLNGHDDVVTFVKGKIEALLADGSLPLLAGETVDVIVSEWMGYGLFFETMLPSVMAARDTVLSLGSGTMFPNVSRIYIEGGSDANRLNYWNDVHGINMAPMRKRMADELTREAWVEIVDEKSIITNRVMLIEHDLNSCTDADLDFEARFELHLQDGILSDIELHQLVISFDIDFAVPGTNVVSFSTGCQSTPTHWKQTSLWFDPLHNCPKLRRSGEIMKGKFCMKRNGENHRSIDMYVSWETGKCGSDGNWVRNMDGIMRRSLIA
jgi:SAM-dependent methyltransferase